MSLGISTPLGSISLGGVAGAIGGALGLGSGSSASSVPAIIEIHDPPDPTSGQVGGLEYSIEFQFNPSKLSLTKSSNWTPQKNAKASAPTPQFGGGQPSTFSLPFTLDIHEPPNPDINTTVSWLYQCLAATQQTTAPGAQAMPYFAVFKWGNWSYGDQMDIFTGYVKQVQVDYVRFQPDGTCTRANITVQLMEWQPPSTPPQNPTSGTRERQRSRTVLAGDTLASIAYEEYGKPTQWRILAEANNIDDPARLPPGRHLLVPLDSATTAEA
jgi:hypothetical protein